MLLLIFFFFFFNDTATTEIYTLSLHDALPICLEESERGGYGGWGGSRGCGGWNMTQAGRDQHPSHSDLQPSLWLDHDVSLRRNRRLQPLEELHGFRVLGGDALCARAAPPIGPCQR